MTWLEDLKLAIKAVFHRNPAGLKEEAIATRMGMPRTFLYRYGDLHQEAIIPLERLVQLVLISSDTRPMAALCRACGGEFVAVKPLCRGNEQTALKAVREFSELMNEYSKDIIDGHVTPRELARLEREASEAQQAIAALVQSVRWNTQGAPGQEGGV
jgi:hypothetical protein